MSYTNYNDDSNDSFQRAPVVASCTTLCPVAFLQSGQHHLTQCEFLPQPCSHYSADLVRHIDSSHRSVQAKRAKHGQYIVPVQQYYRTTPTNAADVNATVRTFDALQRSHAHILRCILHNNFSNVAFNDRYAYVSDRLRAIHKDLVQQPTLYQTGDVQQLRQLLQLLLQSTRYYVVMRYLHSHTYLPDNILSTASNPTYSTTLHDKQLTDYTSYAVNVVRNLMQCATAKLNLRGLHDQIDELLQTMVLLHLTQPFAEVQPVMVICQQLRATSDQSFAHTETAFTLYVQYSTHRYDQVLKHLRNLAAVLYDVHNSNNVTAFCILQSYSLHLHTQLLSKFNTTTIPSSTISARELLHIMHVNSNSDVDVQVWLYLVHNVWKLKVDVPEPYKRYLTTLPSLTDHQQSTQQQLVTAINEDQVRVHLRSHKAAAENTTHISADNVALIQLLDWQHRHGLQQLDGHAVDTKPLAQPANDAWGDMTDADDSDLLNALSSLKLTPAVKPASDSQANWLQWLGMSP